MDPEVFVHPALAEIRSYDQQNGTEYYRTLQVYSLTFHDREATAQELCVHRNTLAYRLGRINELFGLPFEDTRTALALLNSFQLLDVRFEP